MIKDYKNNNNDDEFRDDWDDHDPKQHGIMSIIILFITLAVVTYQACG